MTVSELIEKLRQFDGDMEVKTAAQSGDYWGTLLANDIAMLILPTSPIQTITARAK